jgi:ubiquinol-cytochrome c reductase iron-sulfur subunit
VRAASALPDAVVPNGSRFSSPDNNIVENRLPAGGAEEKRAFTYFVLGGARVLYASAARLAVINAVATLSASADVLALAAVEVDLSGIQEGQTITVKWRGKPVFIKHRTDEQIKDVATTNIAELRHAQTDAERVKDPKWYGGAIASEMWRPKFALFVYLCRLIVLGVCTHLGCVPISNAGDYNGWYCPCHGSHYDGSGRIRRGPAPLNLEVPEYKFLTPTQLVLG